MWFRAFVSLVALSAAGCVGPGLSPVSHKEDPLGWPAKALSSVGRTGVVTGVPLVRETGRVASALGDMLESPALLEAVAPAALPHGNTMAIEMPNEPFKDTLTRIARVKKPTA